MSAVVVRKPEVRAQTLRTCGQVAGYLVGCALPLSALEAQLLEVFGGVEGLTPAAVRNMVLELAARKSFAGKGGALAARVTLTLTLCCLAIARAPHVSRRTFPPGRMVLQALCKPAQRDLRCSASWAMPDSQAHALSAGAVCIRSASSVALGRVRRFPVHNGEQAPCGSADLTAWGHSGVSVAGHAGGHHRGAAVAVGAARRKGAAKGAARRGRAGKEVPAQGALGVHLSALLPCAKGETAPTAY